jgi:hypothetical protein
MWGGIVVRLVDCSGPVSKKPKFTGEELQVKFSGGFCQVIENDGRVATRRRLACGIDSILRLCWISK